MQLKQVINKKIQASILSKAFEYADSQVFTKDYFLARHKRMLALLKLSTQENAFLDATRVLEHEDALIYKSYVEEFLAKKVRGPVKDAKARQALARKKKKAESRGTYKEILGMLEKHEKT